MHSFEVHSNESACRKKVRLGLEQVKYCIMLLLYSRQKFNTNIDIHNQIGVILPIKSFCGN